MSDYEDMSSDESEKLNFDDEDDDSSSEEEVLPVYSASESDAEDDDSEKEANISDSDIDENNGDDLPDPKAWGKNKRSYYNGDDINDKANKILNEEEEEAVKLEEEEARAIQKRLVAKIDDADLAFDLPIDVADENEEGETSFDQNEKVQIDLSKMNDQEKMELIQKESPELLTYIEDFKALTACIQDELLPVINILKKKKSKLFNAGQFIKLYNQLIMNYSTNIVFYVLLKSRKTDTKQHPCRQWLEKYKKLVYEVKLTYDTVFKPQIKLIMQNDFKSLSRMNRKRKLNVVTSKPESITTTDLSNDEFAEDVSEDDEIDSSRDVEMKENDSADEDEPESKRPITYQIAKNKGLTPHRKKELRNPRVKHRMKYRKAKIRRKGQIREVRKEMHKYDGEISGIKANVVKSVKFKV